MPIKLVDRGRESAYSRDMEDYCCDECDGTGETCSVHGNSIGCDCDAPTMVPCDACGGTGVSEEDEDES